MHISMAVRMLVWPIERTHISLTSERYVLSYCDVLPPGAI